jgi:thiamine-phosphate pyrophosphorylase
MSSRCLLYYITDRNAFPGNKPSRHRRLLEKIAEAARAGVDYIQLREKDLTARELESLAREAMSLIARQRSEGRGVKTTFLINSRVDIGLADGADGVHLRSDDIAPQEVRAIWRQKYVGTTDLGSSATAPTASGRPSPKDPLIGVSCHSPEEVAQAAASGASFVVFAPVFEKVTREKRYAPETHPAGLAMLEQACRVDIPVLALGGVTLSNARSCLEAGAAGIAGIRLFQENEVGNVAEALRKLAR